MLTFGFEQRLQAQDQRHRDADDPGVATKATTTLSFKLQDATALQSLTVTGNLGLHLAAGAASLVPGPEGRRLVLRYAQQAASAAWTVEARYRQDDIASLLAPADFPDGLPVDFAELTGGGTRTAYGADTSLVLGQTAPVGITLSAGFDAIDYGKAAPALTDTTRQRSAAALRMRFSPVVEATVGLRVGLAGEDGRSRRTTTAEIGLRYDISPLLRLEGIAGHTAIKTESDSVATARTRGPNGALSVTRLLRDGLFSAGVVADTTDSGTRLDLRIRRRMEMSRAGVDATVGVARSADGEVALVGSFAWQAEVPGGSVNMMASRSMQPDNDDEERLRSSLSASYSAEISALSSIALNITHFRRDDAPDGAAQRRTSIGARYSYSPDRDWTLSVGYVAQLSDDAAVSDTGSLTLYITVGRQLVSWR
jgi:hypothetical protein